ncbi:hypothetical protein FOA43_001602 [Brettanomyces nanus]|uniref:Peroxisomal ATPase PEX1 n=1 Tax=Eeniella nana TaxID=13502 RepID=A0A875RU81_EENNA|nr:uncharacterized protein FOA43_001602 [Brettanomyces nanus]QPG74277.1 hypothetical protein FOA43_001602 [Brettanomyces nanus]
MMVFKPLQTCLINVPGPFISPFINSTNLLIQNVVIQIKTNRENSKALYCGWTGFFSSNPNTIEIDSSFASLSGIPESAEVRIQLILIDEISRIQSAELEPITSEDWELTQLYAGTIENKFLNQVRALSTHQIVLVHPNSHSSSSIIRYRVKTIHSTNKEIALGILTNDSELHIAPKFSKPANEEISSSIQRSRRGVNSTVVQSPLLTFSPVLCRSISLPNRQFSHVSKDDSSNYSIFINLAGLPLGSVPTNTRYVAVSVVEGPGTPKRARSTKEDQKNGKVMVAKLIIDPYAPIHSVGLSELLAISLGVEDRVGEEVLIEPLKHDSSSLSNCRLVLHKIITETPKQVAKTIRNSDSRRIAEHKIKKIEHAHTIQKLCELFGLDSESREIPLINGMKLPIIEGLFACGCILNVELKHAKKALPWIVLRRDDLSLIRIGEDILKPESFVQTKPLASDQYLLVGRDDIVRQIIKDALRHVPVIIYGSSGSGKTLVCHDVSLELKNIGYYTKTVDCSELMTTKDPEELKKLFTEIVPQELLWHEPALLVLDNVDTLIPKESEQGETGFSTQITELLASRFTTLCAHKEIILILTSKSRDSVNPVTFQKHLVEKEVKLTAPNKDLRFVLLSHFITKYPGHRSQDCEFLRDIAADTEGYLPFDLENLCGRAFHDVVSSDWSASSFEFCAENFERALKDYTPSSLRGIKLQKGPSTSWSDIGGLKDVKRVLLETLEWPTKYAPIFAQCPLRLRSGILLYGHPGCGKTLLASAVAAQCGLNFISIKGPEILNKYIGASEQSVRELFERASAAKPCILFFDEFDSIAPKRGHDSTGVTDRIVNQLLTQMDGAEGLDGVYVLAATSRPDLIDSALLRPGRLDKSVLCDMPNYEDRLDILNTIIGSGQFVLGEDVRLETVAKETEGFSGADLQAIVYNSYLKAVHENLQNVMEKKSVNNHNASSGHLEYFLARSSRASVIKDRKATIGSKLKNISLSEEERADSADFEANSEASNIPQKPIVKIRSIHIKEGLKETNRSISDKELVKFNGIYSQFMANRREGNLPDGEASNEIGGRVSLM